MKRTLDLPADLWAAFDRAAEVRGSYEAVLRWWLTAGGVFESDESVGLGPQSLREVISASLGLRRRPTKPPRGGKQ